MCRPPLARRRRPVDQDARRREEVQVRGSDRPSLLPGWPAMTTWRPTSRTCLVSGAAGFIGARIAEAMLGHGYEVVGVDNLSTGARENFPADGEFLLGDIRENVPSRAWDVIYHCAASYKDRSEWELDASTNVLGTLNVVREAQRSGAKIVYCQTSLCYGPSPASPVRPTAALDPRGSYAVSKTAGECYIRDSGVPYVSLRLAN